MSKIDNFTEALLYSILFHGCIEAYPEELRTMESLSLMESIGLVKKSLGFFHITGKGRKYLKASEFERVVMEAAEES